MRDSAIEIPERNRALIRFALGYMALTMSVVAVWILVAPRNFFDEFPGLGEHWVSALPPFNEHLLRDYGAAGLGLAVVTTLAAAWMERRLVQAVAFALIAAVLPHFIYHLTTTEAYSTGDNIASLAVLVSQIALPAAVLVLAREPRPTGAAKPSTPTPKEA